MELGNWVFGNSRGNFPIPRGVGYEDELYRLFDAYAPDRDNSWGEYGIEFENDTFSVMPYYWGECVCGWDSIDDGHRAEFALKHRPGCYRHEYNSLPRDYADEGWHDKQIQLLKPIYENLGWDTESENWWYGCAVRCSCDYYERLDTIYEEYAEEFGYMGHKPDCPLIKDNFHFKPTDFGVQWYKYPMRDAYMSEELSVEEFAEIIDRCIESL